MVASLELLAPGVYAWLHDEHTHTATNSGVVIAEDGITVIDTGLVPSLASNLVEALTNLTPLPTRRLVMTGSHIDLVGGSSAFPLPAVYGSAQTSAHLDQPANRDTWRRLYPDYAQEFEELETRPVTHTVTQAAHLCPATIAVPCSGLQFENLAVQVPGANVVFAGALASFGVVPLGFEADFEQWIAALEHIATWGELFVPAHGPIGGVEDLAILRRYLEACIEAAGSLSNMANGPWDTWTDARYTQVNVERAHMLSQGDPAPPPSLLRLLGLS